VFPAQTHTTHRLHTPPAWPPKGKREEVLQAGQRPHNLDRCHDSLTAQLLLSDSCQTPFRLLLSDWRQFLRATSETHTLRPEPSRLPGVPTRQHVPNRAYLVQPRQFEADRG
jgi:hypothetical protein